MSELLQRIQGEIRQRRTASAAAVLEYERLQSALVALDGVAGAAAPRSVARTTNVTPTALARKAPRRQPAKRAPRGANRDAVLRVVGDRPGVGVDELASATGVKKPVLYALLGRLVEQSELVKEALPSGSTGYALPRAGAPESTGTRPTSGGRADGARDARSD
jgi:hypothetical protein